MSLLINTAAMGRSTGVLTLDDSYSESNFAGPGALFILSADSLSTQECGQAFTSSGGILDSAMFYLARLGTITGNATAKLYALTGTYGTTAVPTGAALAVSDGVDVSTISTTRALVTFNFTSANRYVMSNSTQYFIEVAFSASGDNSANYITIGCDNTSPTHGGNIAYFQGSVWNAFSAGDACFYVYVIR